MEISGVLHRFQKAAGAAVVVTRTCLTFLLRAVLPILCSQTHDHSICQHMGFFQLCVHRLVECHQVCLRTVRVLARAFQGSARAPV
jgi:hypothetical protein